MNSSRKFWRASFFILLLTALCGSFAFPTTYLPVQAAPQAQTGTADLTLTMVVNNASPNKTDPVIFTIKITNAGPDVATNVEVEDILPAGLLYVSDSGAGTYDNNTGSWLVGNVGVEPNNSVTLNIIVNAITKEVKINEAHVVSSDQLDPNGPASASATVTPQLADISVIINGIAPVSNASVGDIIVFTVRASNSGPNKATGVKVLDLLPAGLTYITHTSNGSYSPNTGNWNVGDLNSGASKELTITARVTTSSTKTNSAEVIEVDQLDPDSTPSNGNTSEDDYASFVLSSLSSNLSLTMSVDNTTPDGNDLVKFTIVVTNSGPNNATGVIVKDLLPAGVEYVSDDSNGAYNSATGIWSVGSLLASGVGSTDTLEITSQVKTVGQKVNVAEVWRSNQADPNSTPGNSAVGEDDYGSVSLTPQTSDLSLAKRMDNPSASAGELVEFTITLRNSGPDVATNVSVRDLLPSGYSFEPPSDPSAGTYDDTTGIWDVGTVAVDTSVTLKISAHVQSSGVKKNVAEIIVSDQLDPDSTPNNNSTTEDDDDVAPKADLSLDKSVDNGRPTMGSTITFTLTIKNEGTADATGVTVKDLLPTGLTYISNNGGSSYDRVTGIWNVGRVEAGATKRLNIVVNAGTIGKFINIAEIWTSNQFDGDSIPGDSSTTTDDDDKLTVVVYYPKMSVMINEVAWAGTAASSSDEWIELYNPGPNPVNLAGWVIKTADNSLNVSLSSYTLQVGEYYLLERSDNNTVSDIAANQIYSGELGNSNEILQLYDTPQVNHIVDTANSNGGIWPAGSSTTYGSMERRGIVVDSDTAWTTNTGKVHWGLDANGRALWGTPKHANWALSVTATPSRTPTATRTPFAFRTSTPSRVPPPQLVAINEFVPRPGFDWNNDGSVGVGDEFIELINHGTVNVNLSGYTLDDEANIGSEPYPLPSVIIKPGERIVFYGSETGLLLSDGGDGVRLLKPNGQLIDAYNYTVARYPNQSYCRLPDDGGLDDWNQNCYPTPGLQNSLSGGNVVPPSNSVNERLLCPIADTLPDDFVFAECSPFGNNIWRRAYWDELGWYDEKILPGINSRWDVFAD